MLVTSQFPGPVKVFRWAIIKIRTIYNRRLEANSMPKYTINVKKESITTHYKFIKELGRGASGVCFKALLRENQSVARCVKKVSKGVVADGEHLPQEVILLDQLSHPDIVRLYQVYQDEKSFYIVTDLCEGGELFDYLDAEGVLSQHEAKEIFVQLISAVGYCHQKKIVHRDLKPENFLIYEKTSKGQVPNLKLIDFDLSFQWREKCTEEIIAKEGKRIIGTPYYIAPEVLKGKYDYRCDIWSAGVILYILVTGVPPFNGSSPGEILKQIEKQKYSLDIPEMEDVSLLLKDLLRKMIAPLEKRISVADIFKHPWMKIAPKKTKLQIDYTSMLRYSRFSRLKQIAATYLAMQMTSKQLSKYEELFKDLDLNKDGFLSVEELRAGLANGKQTNKELDNLLQMVETDDSGMMNYSDFIASFVNEKVINSKENLRSVFRMIDNDGNGVVDKEELNLILNRHGLKKKGLRQKNISEEINQIFTAADKNNDGKIDFEEFVATVCSL